MSEEKDDSPSAEELLDDMSEAEEEGDDEGMSEETMDELGGLFGVSSSGSDDTSTTDEPEGDGSASGEEQTADEPDTSESDASSSDSARFDPATASGEQEAISEDDLPSPENVGDQESDAQTVQMSADAAEAIAQSGEFDAVEKDEFRDKLKEMAAEAGDEELAEQIETLAGGMSDESADEPDRSDETTPGPSAAEPPPESSPQTPPSEGAPPAAEASGPPASSGDEDGAVGGVFAPSGSGADEEANLEAAEPGDAYLDEGDLGDYDDDDGISSTVFLVGGGIALLLTVAIVVVFAFTNQGKRLAHLLQGDLKEYEYQQKEQEEQQLLEKQREIIEKTPKIGILRLAGKPRHAEIQVDGQHLYAQTPKTKHWRRIRLEPDTQFPVFDIGSEREISVSSPGWKTKNWKLSLGMWTPIGASVPNLEDAALKYEKRLDVTLDPKTPARLTEFQKRMAKDPENNYYGKISIESKPKGAKIIFNTKPLLNEKGEPLETPATFEKRYYKDEETGKVEEEKIRVDTAKHHKIVLKMPEDKTDKDFPSFVTPVKRQMWKCNWKEDKKPENPSPKACNYIFELNVDFQALNSFSKDREKERAEIKKAWNKAREELNALATKQKKGEGAKGSKSKGGK